MVKRDGDKIIFEIPVDRVKDLICMNKMYIEKVKQNAELQKKVNKLKLVIKNMEQGYYPLTQLREIMEEEKSVAVKEFADKVKEYINNKVIEDFDDSDSVQYYTIDLDEFESKIDELLKEYKNDN